MSKIKRQLDLASTFIIPNWLAPANVRAIQTTRSGGVSNAPYNSFNLGAHVSDDPLAVAHNRQLLSPYLPNEPVWINQVHGICAIDASIASLKVQADAAYSIKTNTVCVTMTADCLPVLLCDEAGTVVAAVHAGWRGLLDGVIENAVKSMQLAMPNLATQSLMAWLGPAIGPLAFQVGNEVHEAFITKDANAALAFESIGNEKWLGNIYQLARQRLNIIGVSQIYGGDLCTYNDETRFFSYRRDGVTGRMASIIWLT